MSTERRTSQTQRSALMKGQVPNSYLQYGTPCQLHAQACRGSPTVVTNSLLIVARPGVSTTR
jgi:hypothetical protein